MTTPVSGKGGAPLRRRGLRTLLAPAVAAVLAAGLLPALAATSSQAAEPRTVDADALWNPTGVRLQDTLQGNDRRVTPSEAAKYTLDDVALESVLDRAPLEDTAAAAGQPVTVSIPSPAGELVEFEVVESPIMEPGLAAAHPEISTYAGTSVEDPRVTVRFDVTPMGFHASVRTLQSDGASSWYVDPAYNGDDSVYLSYFGKSLPAPEKPLIEPGEIKPDLQSKVLSQGTAARAGVEVIRRTYRLALVTDPSYANYFGSQNVFAEKVTMMNRVNQIYNDDLAIRMLLIDETDKLNLDTPAKAFLPDGPCGTAPCYLPEQLDPETGGCTGALLNRNRTVLGQLVGASDYDIGHIALGINGGGIAGLGVVGGDGKARGCTGLPKPTGDFMAIDYVAHEMGHQFSGNHTFNGTQANCGGNKAAPSVEPGSGSSVMAYAGICAGDDLQPHTDPFFSQWSQQEMMNYVTSQRSAISEVQTVSLRDFDTPGESFTLTYGDQTTEPITRGLTYNTIGIKAALDPIVLPTGATVTVTGWNNSTVPSDEGFTVTFNEPAPKDRPSLQLNPGADVGGFVGETAQGGPVENQGFQTQTLGNRAPVVTAADNKSIPVRTPFTLTGSGTDPDQDPLIYLWEQKDRGSGTGTALQSEMKTNGPIFRIFGKYANVTDEAALEYNSPGQNSAGGNPSRTFPDMQQVLAGHTNAKTGTCPDPQPSDYQNGKDGALADGPVLECFSEWLPTSDYTGSAEANNLEPSLNFRLTARDVDPDSGGYAFDDTKLTIDKTAGPFLVTSLGETESVDGADEGTVTWTVAGTNKPTLAENVKISLSTDGGETFTEVLAGSTPNDGSETIEWPNVDTDEARLKIEAVGNYFFDVNDAEFSIVASDVTAPDTTITSGPKPGKVLLTDTVSVDYESSEAGSSFDCLLDASPADCGDTGVTFTEMLRQTHRFSVAATDAAGNRDQTPAELTWTVPQDDRDLRKSSGEFKRGTADRAYLGTFTSSRTKGSTLRQPVEDATKLVLVAGKGPRHGSVSVYLNGRLLESVSLRSEEKMAKKRITVATFDEARSGLVKIVVDRDKPVRIDGLGVVTAP